MHQQLGDPAVVIVQQRHLLGGQILRPADMQAQALPGPLRSARLLQLPRKGARRQDQGGCVVRPLPQPNQSVLSGLGQIRQISHHSHPQTVQPLQLGAALGCGLCSALQRHWRLKSGQESRAYKVDRQVR